MPTSESQKKWYLKNKGTAKHRARSARNARIYYAKRKNDPEFMERQRAYGRKRYHEKIKQFVDDADRNRLKLNTQRYREKKKDVKIKLQQYLGGCCVSCGITDPRLLDFDHIDPMTKTMNISAKLSLPWERLVEEANKCQLLCPNCHRIKTQEQRELNSYVRKTREYRNENRTVFSLPEKLPLT